MTELEAAEAELQDLQGQAESYKRHIARLNEELQTQGTTLAASGKKQAINNQVDALRKLGPLVIAQERKVALLRTKAEQEAERQAAEAVDKARAETRDDATFWFRRFMLSLQIGNGAALIALMNGAFSADKEGLFFKASLAWAPAIYFTVGVIAAGGLPGLLAARRGLDEVRGWNEKVRKGLLFAVVNVGLPGATVVAIGGFLLGVISVAVTLTQVHDETLKRIATAKPAVVAAHPKPPATSAGQLVVDPAPVRPDGSEGQLTQKDAGQALPPRPAGGPAQAVRVPSDKP